MYPAWEPSSTPVCHANNPGIKRITHNDGSSIFWEFVRYVNNIFLKFQLLLRISNCSDVTPLRNNLTIVWHCNALIQSASHSFSLYVWTLNIILWYPYHYFPCNDIPWSRLSSTPPLPTPKLQCRYCMAIFSPIISLTVSSWWGWSWMKTSINSNVVHEGNCRPIKQGLVSLPGELFHEEHSFPLLPPGLS